MDKQTYDEMRFKETHEKEKAAQKNKIKKYAKITLWTMLIVLIFGIGGWYMAKSGFFAYDPLDLCVQHTGVGMHIHSHLKIFVKGEDRKIPANIGISSTCMRPIHTHDDSGTLHLEFPTQQDVALNSFFKIWEEKFNLENVKMKVNRENKVELQYIMRDGDKIELYFE